MSDNKQAVLTRLYEKYLQENIGLREQVAALEVRVAELEENSADGDEQDDE